MPALSRGMLRRPDGPLTALGLHAVLVILTGLVCTLVWVVTGLGYPWPVWVWFGGAVLLALHVCGLRAARAPAGRGRIYVLQVDLSVTVALLVLAVWALTGYQGSWPAWVIGSLAVLLVPQYVDRLQHPAQPRSADLTRRVDELTRSRSGALDVQAAELRRIERDLHDGAQARLVALSMQLGRAEQRLASGGDEQALALVRGAREEARLAIAELRDLARGISPPVLVDRGLEAAVEALGRRSPLAVTVSGDAGPRPSPVVESAAYFVVSEALTNATKHAGGAAVRITLARDAGRLRITIVDDGPGGADPAGDGLLGLAQRTRALDGTLVVTSPPGAGTTIEAELPCGS